MALFTKQEIVEDHSYGTYAKIIEKLTVFTRVSGCEEC